MAGRIGKYKPETLKIGEKLALEGAALKLPYQYAWQFRKKTKYNLRVVRDKKKIFIERIA